MFDIKKENCNTVMEKLLWNIQEYLKKDAPLVLESKEKTTVAITNNIPKVEEPKIKNCKFCGESHMTMGLFLACSRKNKK